MGYNLTFRLSKHLIIALAPCSNHIPLSLRLPCTPTKKMILSSEHIRFFWLFLSLEGLPPCTPFPTYMANSHLFSKILCKYILCQETFLMLRMGKVSLSHKPLVTVTCFKHSEYSSVLGTISFIFVSPWPNKMPGM